MIAILKMQILIRNKSKRRQWRRGFPPPHLCTSSTLVFLASARIPLGSLFDVRAWWPTPVCLPGESPGTEEPGGLQFMGLRRVRHEWATKHSTISLSSFPHTNFLWCLILLRKARMYVLVNYVGKIFCGYNLTWILMSLLDCEQLRQRLCDQPPDYHLVCGGWPVVLVT